MKANNISFIRILALVMALMMLASVALTSCDKTPDEPKDSGSQPQGSQSNEPVDSGSNEPVDSDNDAPVDSGSNEPGDITTPEYDVITVAKALELCGEPGNISAEQYYIRGIIETITNAQFGAMVIKDDTGSIPVYGTYSTDGKSYPDFDYKPVKGDEVLLYCILQNYNGTKEVKRAELIEYKNNQGNIDVSQYAPATITEARAAQKGANLKVSGVVARITYSTGMKPNGFVLVSGGESIYVYDGDTAARVAIGNRIEIAGTKDYWILDSEIGSASKFGYNGCNQLTDAILISNDNKTDNSLELDKFPTSTVKELIETPVSEDITTKVFKVNALVKKTPGTGFVNYYLYDIDGTTGSYTYTQCSGDDFAWLDEFDGKICTVYLTLLNAKSTSTGCQFRFLPVAVFDEGYRFDTNKAAEMVLNYYAVGQFLSTYSGNPELELLTSVSSDLLGFTNATISYASSDTSVIAFNEKDNKTIMECLKAGSASVTITVTHNGKTATKTIIITVAISEVTDYVNVQAAINAQVGDRVTVHGIVGPSLVNRDGFYLIDESGVIALIVKERAVFDGLMVGHEIIIEGMRDKFHNGEGTHAGQAAITDVTVVANSYGNHSYDTSTFITDKTLADLCALSVDQDYSTMVFVLNATVMWEESPWYANAKLTDGNVSINLYSSNANKQYGFLKQYIGQEITVELALCNWNNKTYHQACVLAVRTADGKVINNLNFNAN